MSEAVARVGIRLSLAQMPFPSQNENLTLPAFPLLACVAVTVRADVDFEKDVKPILETNCVRCHNPKGTEFEKGDTDLNLSTLEGATESKSTIVPGDAFKSKLYTTTVLPDDAKKLMPPRNKVTHDLERLATAETETLKNWINEGAKWPASISLIARKKGSEARGTGTREAQIVGQNRKRIAASPLPKTAGEMAAYTVTIPGTEVTYDMTLFPEGNSKWAARRMSRVGSRMKAPCMRWKFLRFGWRSAKSHGTNSSCSCIRMRKRSRAR